jgi:hypothetical protein
LDGFVVWKKIKYKIKKLVVWTLNGDEELYVPDDVLEEASDQMLPKKPKFTHKRERKPVSERQ